MHRRFVGLVCAASPLGAAAITAEMQAVLDVHNVYRCMHDIPLFTWDDDIAANAQSWADNGVYEHSTSAQRMINGVQAGENLAWGYPSRTGVDSTRAWYHEIQYTMPYGTADSISDSVPAGNAIGHYTQVVWSTSTKLGCGKGKATQQCQSGPCEGDYWVCQYGPAGNYQGQFTEKVPAPVKSLQECNGQPSDVPGGHPGYEKPAPKSACTPSVLLPNGGLCVYGYQCQSKFCCPYMKACLPPGAGISSADLLVNESMKAKIIDVVFTNGRTCSGAGSNSQSCMQTGDGQPLSGWDQSVCGCKDFYMEMYNSDSWISLNEGYACPTPAPLPQASTSRAPSTVVDFGLSFAALAAIVSTLRS